MSSACTTDGTEAHYSSVEQQRGVSCALRSILEVALRAPTGLLHHAWFGSLRGERSRRRRGFGGEDHPAVRGEKRFERERRRERETTSWWFCRSTFPSQASFHAIKIYIVCAGVRATVSTSCAALLCNRKCWESQPSPLVAHVTASGLAAPCWYLQGGALPVLRRGLG